jgi:tRNA-2-methylthio-N6-dimethylallyladenosine synthase
MGNLLESMGYVRAPSIEEADVVLFNTCTIREKAYHKAESEIGRSGLFKANRQAIVGVCGCVAQQEGEALRNRFEHIDFIFGPDQLASLPHLIERAKEGVFTSALDFIYDSTHPDFPHRVAFGNVVGGSVFVAIMKGCNCACSYCIVPKVRGREVSLPADDVITEVRSCVDRGAKEVTLLGQNVNAYGDKATFAELIHRIAGETDIQRIRFTSPHPRDVGDDVIAAYANELKLCPHIHLPVQAGSNKVLKTMKRGYTRERYFEIVDELRKARPGISITTDMIVGFCGETDEDFEETIDLMKRVRFDSMFAFCYSSRPGTYAAEALADDVAEETKRKRLKHVLDLQRTIQMEENKKQEGALKNVLVLKEDMKNEGKLTSRGEDNRLIHFTGQRALIGSIVPVRVMRASIHSLQGEIEYDSKEDRG